MAAVPHSSIEIPIDFFEATKPNDNYLPGKSGDNLSYSIMLAQDIFNLNAKRCGYQAKVNVHAFSNDDTIDLFTRVKKASATIQPWLIIGPRQSDNYLVISKAAPEVPSLSPMASNEKVFQLPSTHLTLGIRNSLQAKVLAKEANKHTPGGSYVTISRTSCTYCSDFSTSFDIQAKEAGLKKLSHFEVSSNTPEIIQIARQIRALKPTFILLPNTWDSVSFLIKGLAIQKLDVTYLGGDSWGDQAFGSLAGGNIPNNLRALMVRPYPSADLQMKGIRSCNKIVACRNDPPTHSAGAAYLRTFENLAKFVCQTKPKNFLEFKINFEKLGKKHLNIGKTVSVIEVQGTKYKHLYEAALD